jgi:hypothetical protein
MGRNEIEPREGGTTRWSIGGFTEESTVTAWDPPKHFASTGTPSPDGAFHQFDYRVEDLGAGRSSVRYVHSGMLTGDWEREYEAMSEGDPMYVHKLFEYLTYFRGRFATPVDAWGPKVADRDAALATFRRELGLSDELTDGQRVRLAPAGLSPIEGVVDYVSQSFFGVRASDALYRFIYGYEGNVMVGHHLFSDGVNQEKAEGAWRSWLARSFASDADGSPAS